MVLLDLDNPVTGVILEVARLCRPAQAEFRAVARQLAPSHRQLQLAMRELAKKMQKSERRFIRDGSA